MTVNELRDKLSEYDGNLDVFATWEGIEVAISGDRIGVEKADRLLLDVNSY